ncbi:MAG: ABC transporter substrate-binding protein [Pseudomonadota bacterium]
MKRMIAFSIFAFSALLASASIAGDRIVIAGGDLTEIAFALGAGDRVIAVDSTSNFPAETAGKEQIGYVRRLSAEGILSLTPDLVIASHDAGPPTALSQIEAAGVRMVQGPEGDDTSAILAKIQFVADALDKSAEGEAMAKDVSQNLTEVAEKVAKLKDRPKVLFVLSVDRGTPMVGGANTSADSMIALAGAQNAAGDFEGFKPMSREAIIQAAPDVILMMAQHAERSGGAKAVLERPEIALTPAGQNGRAVTMEGMLLLGFGPRTPAAIAELARELHPDDAAEAGL